MCLVRKLPFVVSMVCFATNVGFRGYIASAPRVVELLLRLTSASVGVG